MSCIEASYDWHFWDSYFENKIYASIQDAYAIRRRKTDEKQEG